MGDFATKLPNRTVLGPDPVGISGELASAMASMPGGAIAFLAVSIVLFIALGSVLEGIPAMGLFGSLLFPIAQQLGLNEVHYAMVAVLAMGLP